jgi:hypothetical protein
MQTIADKPGGEIVDVFELPQIDKSPAHMNCFGMPQANAAISDHHQERVAPKLVGIQHYT